MHERFRNKTKNHPVFRSFSPYKWRTDLKIPEYNYKRVAEVWMDDYKELYFDRVGHTTATLEENKEKPLFYISFYFPVINCIFFEFRSVPGISVLLVYIVHIPIFF